jgi:alpha-tubulin suppressor-like RCC1 family protein
MRVCGLTGQTACRAAGHCASAALVALCICAVINVGLVLDPATAAASEEACPSGAPGGAVVDWGHNLAEQLGLGFHGGYESTPGTVVGLEHVRQVEAGFEFTLALTAECTLMAWGSNRQGQLGDGNHWRAVHPHEVVTEAGPFTDVKEVAVAGSHVIALLYNGTVWTWGASEFGERGNGESGWERSAKQSEPSIARPRTEPAEVEAVRTYAQSKQTTVRQVAAGGKRDYVVLADGEVLGWGDDHAGILDVSEPEKQGKCIGELHPSEPSPCVKTPQPLPGLSGIERIAAGENTTYAIRNEGKEVLSWGVNGKGQLGDGATENSATPVHVDLNPTSRVAEVSADGEFALARLANGTVYGWGADGGDQIGIPPGSEPDVTTPERVPSLEHVVAVAAGYGNSLALEEEANREKVLYAFGNNGRYGLLGLGLNEQKSVPPTEITGLPSIARIALSSTTGAAVLEGEAPPPTVEVASGPEELLVSWHVPYEAVAIRYREVGSEKYTPWESCYVGPECSERRYKGLTPAPYEVVFSAEKSEQGTLVRLKPPRKVIATPKPAPNAPENVSAPSFTATPSLLSEWFRVGQTLTAEPGSWSPAATSYEYRWLSCRGRGAEGSEEETGGECAVVSSGDEYEPSSAQTGATVVVEVIASNASGSSAAVSQPELILGSEEEEPPSFPANTKSPSISGSPVAGSTLTANHGEWEPQTPPSAEPALTDNWFLCKNQVEDPEQEAANETGGSCGPAVAAGESFTPGESAIGKWIEIEEHARNAGGTNEKTSVALPVRPAAPPTNLTPPKIEGTIEKGQTLKAEEGTWNNSAENPAWEWFRCEGSRCVEAGPKRTYKVSTADVGYTLEVREKVANVYGVEGSIGSAQATSEPTVTVPKEGAKPESKTLPSIEGAAIQGATLRIVRGTWANLSPGNSPTIVWDHCKASGGECTKISGANNEETYLPETADVGSRIVVTERAVNSGGSTTVESAATAVIAGAVPVDVTPPTLMGDALQGQTLADGHGDWTNQPYSTGYTYQWQRCSRSGAECVEILGASEQDYVASALDTGRTLRVRETASNPTGAGSPAVSASSQIVVPLPPSNTEPPTITGSVPPEKGSPLTAHPGAWTPESVSYSYQWLRCESSGGDCSAIAGASAESYSPAPADVGHDLVVEARAIDEGVWERATSAATAPVSYPTPSIASIEPAVGPAGGGTSVTITGQYLGEATAVQFGSVSATHIERVSETTLKANAPAGSGSVNITVTTAFGTSAATPADQFTYEESPSISGIAPASGPTEGGTAVTISGSNLGSATGVGFGLTGALFVRVLSPTSIEASAPPGSGTVDVTITSPWGVSPTVPADRFTYVPPPSVSGLSPADGPLGGGTVVTISGQNLGEASGVQFGSVSATNLKQLSSTTLEATAPRGTGTVDVTVTTVGGTSATSSADRFTYVPPPSVAALSPAAGAEEGGTVVRISGQNLGEASAVHFGPVSATHLEQISPTALEATAPAGSQPEPVDVTVTTPYGTSTTAAADRFTYVARPTVTNATPGKVSVQGNATITIEGTNFLAGATTVQFGEQAATDVKVSSVGSLTATAPPEPAGIVDVTVTTPGGTSATSSKDHFAYAPEITSISPSIGPAKGGNVVAVKGVGFGPGTTATTIKFAKVGGSALNCASSTECVVTAPAGSAGKVDISATVNGATSALVPADKYIYE